MRPSMRYGASPVLLAIVLAMAACGGSSGPAAATSSSATASSAAHSSGSTSSSSSAAAKHDLDVAADATVRSGGWDITVTKATVDPDKGTVTVLASFAPTVVEGDDPAAATPPSADFDVPVAISDGTTETARKDGAVLVTADSSSSSSSGAVPSTITPTTTPSSDEARHVDGVMVFPLGDTDLKKLKLVVGKKGLHQAIVPLNGGLPVTSSPPPHHVAASALDLTESAGDGSFVIAIHHVVGAVVRTDSANGQGVPDGQVALVLTISMECGNAPIPVIQEPDAYAVIVGGSTVQGRGVGDSGNSCGPGPGVPPHTVQSAFILPAPGTGSFTLHAWSGTGYNDGVAGTLVIS